MLDTADVYPVSQRLDQHDWVRIFGHWLFAASVVNFWVVETRWFARVLVISQVRRLLM